MTEIPNPYEQHGEVIGRWGNDRQRLLRNETEEHIWIPGWLREFTDSDLASLICPRPLLVEQGKADGIGWWPQMLQEYEATCEHYRKLGIEDRIEIDCHEGGHEIRMEKSLDFLKKWLQP